MFTHCQREAAEISLVEQGCSFSPPVASVHPQTNERGLEGEPVVRQRPSARLGLEQAALPVWELGLTLAFLVYFLSNVLDSTSFCHFCLYTCLHFWVSQSKYPSCCFVLGSNVWNMPRKSSSELKSVSAPR